MKKTTKRNEYLEGKPTHKIIRAEELAPADMPNKQSGAYRYLVRLARQMGATKRLAGVSQLPSREEFFRELSYRSGIPDLAKLAGVKK